MMGAVAFWSVVLESLFWSYSNASSTDDVLKVLSAVFGALFFALSLGCMGAIAWGLL